MTRALRALLALGGLAAAAPALADGNGGAESGHVPFLSRADGHAPIGVMGDHMHEPGELMLSYRYIRMRMDGSRDEDDEIDSGDVFERGFLVNPTDMDTEVHLFGVMYAPVEWFTGVLMVPFIQKQMDHVNGPFGFTFTTQSEGIGDLRFMGLWRLWEDDTHHFHAHTGVSFPTGEIRESDLVRTPMDPARQTLPYPMQIGSGTFDLIPGITYLGHTEQWSWGAQALGTIRTGENENEYRLGNRADATFWVAKPWAKWLSTSLRAQWSSWGNIEGEDPRIDKNRNVVPTADPNRRGGHMLELLAGVNFYPPLGRLGAHRFAVEAGFPAWQYRDGPQLETDWRVVVGWQLSFAGLWP